MFVGVVGAAVRKKKGKRRMKCLFSAGRSIMEGYLWAVCVR